MLADLVIIALSAAFFASLAERWVDHPVLRGTVSLIASLVGSLILGYTQWSVIVLATGAAFLALIAILVGERLATPQPIAVDSRRR